MFPNSRMFTGEGFRESVKFNSDMRICFGNGRELTTELSLKNPKYQSLIEVCVIVEFMSLSRSIELTRMPDTIPPSASLTFVYF